MQESPSILTENGMNVTQYELTIRYGLTIEKRVEVVMENFT